MLIADNFILLNFPKTASTFARKVIKKAYRKQYSGFIDKILLGLGLKAPPFRELILPNKKVKFRGGRDQHGTYEQIPPEYKDSRRELVSIFRNPFDSYVSRYKYGSWKKNNPEDLSKIESLFPHFPELSFNEYLKYTNEFILPYRLQGISLKKGVTLGLLSIQYIQMYCDNVAKVLSNIDKDYRHSNLWPEHFPKITFLRTENINQELFEFLLRKGLPEENIRFIKTEEKVKVSHDNPYQSYLNREAVEMILDREWLLFDLFPDYLPEDEFIQSL